MINRRMTRALLMGTMSAALLLTLLGVFAAGLRSASAQGQHSAAISLSDTRVPQGTEITVTMTFNNFPLDSDPTTTDYIFRLDVVDADQCEGDGAGFDRYMYQVDEYWETRGAVISGDCPDGDYTVKASIFDAERVLQDTATTRFSVTTEPEPVPEPPEHPATVGIRLQSSTMERFKENYVEMYFGNLGEDDAGGIKTRDYIYRFDVVDHDDCEGQSANADYEIWLVYRNFITRGAWIYAQCEVGEYTAVASLYDGDRDLIATATATFTVVPAVSGPDRDSAAIALSADSVPQGTGIDLTMTYTYEYFPPIYTLWFRTDVEGADRCEGGGMGYYRHIHRIDARPAVRKSSISVNCPPGEYTVTTKLVWPSHFGDLVIASASATFTITESSATSDPTVNTESSATSHPTANIELSPSRSVTEGTDIALTMSFANLESDADTSDTDYIFRADVVNADGCEGGGMGKDRYMYKVDEDPEVRTGSISASCAPGDYTVEVSISSPGNVELASTTADFTVTAPAQQQQQPEPPPSADATLSGLTLSDVTLAFASATTDYTASVANDVTQTTVTPTVNDDGATYAIKLGGVADADGVIPLAVGRNAITIEVTAEDGETTKTYTVTVTRAAPTPVPPATIDLSLPASVTEGTEFTVTMSFANLPLDDNANHTFRADVVDADACEGSGMGAARGMRVVDEDPETRAGTIAAACSPGDYTLEVTLTSADNVELASATAAFSVVEPAPEPVESEPESRAERSAWLEQDPENKPFVGEWRHFTLRGSGLDKVDLSVNVIGFGGAPSSTGAVGYAKASPLPAAGEVCGSAYYSGYQMSVDRTFSLVGCREGTVIIELLDPGNDRALLKRYTVQVTGGP